MPRSAAFTELPKLFEMIEDAVARGLFVAGYFAYECGQYFETTANLCSSSDGALLAWFGVYDRCYRFDHAAGMFLDGVVPGVEAISAAPIPSVSNRPGEIRFGLSDQQFTGCIAQIHNWIRAGDVYQLNFTFPLHTQTAESPADLYRRLSKAQPVDYAAFLHCAQGRHILSLSPELFFRMDRHGAGCRITASP